MNARLTVLVLVSAVGAALVASDAAAPRERRPVPGPAEAADLPPARERPEVVPPEQAGAAARERESREGTADGWPGDLRRPGARIGPPGQPPWPFPPRWWLGVYGYNTTSGVIITRVLPGSPAARAGLEPNDRIVTVAGFQVGFVHRRLYPLGAELQLRAEADGRVLLLVQNCRNGELTNMDVQLAPTRVRDREFHLPGFEEEERPR